MRSKLTLIVFSVLLAIFLAGCSKKSTSNTNADANSDNTNTTVTTTEDSNMDEPADDSTTAPDSNRTKNTGKNTGQTKNGNAPPAKRTAKEPPAQTAEKEIKKKGDRILRDSGGLIKEGERRVRGILNGRP